MYSKRELILFLLMLIYSDLLLAGFVNVEMVECVDGVTSSSDGPLLKPVALKVKKPTWQTGAATPLRRRVPGQNGTSLLLCLYIPLCT
jgi:hypothetical protein